MSNLSALQLEKLSEQELQKLISQSKKQIKKLKTKKVTELNSKDSDVVAVADAVRTLAKEKKVTPAEALTAVAKNMRVGLSGARKPRAESADKYRHPQDPQKTWKGFGKRPLWLVEELNRGRKLEEFII
tara:strand:+ start:249 stop:635 length:387 start_codon:yes stop_codon:yes gene_type:complete